MGDSSVKNSRIKFIKPHAHLHIIGRKSTKFQANPMRDVGGVAETKSHGRMIGRMEVRTEGRADGITQTGTDDDHFYSPAPPTSGYNKRAMMARIAHLSLD